MVDCHAKKMPIACIPLVSDENGQTHNEDCNHATIIGMLLYLAANMRLDLAFTVNQAARYTINPCQSHEEAIQQIC